MKPLTPPELLAGFDHAGGAPAQRHLPVGPALHVGRVVASYMRVIHRLCCATGEAVAVGVRAR